MGHGKHLQCKFQVLLCHNKCWDIQAPDEIWLSFQLGQKHTLTQSLVTPKVCSEVVTISQDTICGTQAFQLRLSAVPCRTISSACPSPHDHSHPSFDCSALAVPRRPPLKIHNMIIKQKEGKGEQRERGGTENVGNFPGSSSVFETSSFPYWNGNGSRTGILYVVCSRLACAWL